MKILWSSQSLGILSHTIEPKLTEFQKFIFAGWQRDPSDGKVGLHCCKLLLLTTSTDVGTLIKLDSSLAIYCGSKRLKHDVTMWKVENTVVAYKQTLSIYYILFYSYSQINNVLYLIVKFKKKHKVMVWKNKLGITLYFGHLLYKNILRSTSNTSYLLGTKLL